MWLPDAQVLAQKEQALAPPAWLLQQELPLLA